MDQQRPLGLCYKCGDTYFLGHQCKRQLLLLEGGEIDEGINEEVVAKGSDWEKEDN